MISFSVSARRNEDVDAWDVRVDAHLDLSEEVTGSPETEEAISDAWVEGEGVRIGRLEALMIHTWPVHSSEGLLELLELNDGDGNTWDTHEEVRSTAAALMRWLNTPAGDGLFLESEEPIETILLSRRLEADPFVDRGALLAMMVQHLSALSPNRVLLAHEEPPESALPTDQQGRVWERARAFLSVGERVGFGRFVALPAEPDEGRAGIHRLLNGMADRPLLIGSVLPDGPDYPEWTVWDDLEIELIDLVEWARARLGVELSLAQGETELAE